MHQFTPGKTPTQRDAVPQICGGRHGKCRLRTNSVIFWIEHKDGSSSEQMKQINKQYAEYSYFLMSNSDV